MTEDEYAAFCDAMQCWADVEAGERFDRETDEMNAANPQWFGVDA